MWWVGDEVCGSLRGLEWWVICFMFTPSCSLAYPKPLLVFGTTSQPVDTVTCGESGLGVEPFWYLKGHFQLGYSAYLGAKGLEVPAATGHYLFCHVSLLYVQSSPYGDWTTVGYPILSGDT